MSALQQAVHLLRPGARAEAVSTIGLELSDEQLHLVQLRRTADGAVVISAHASVPYPDSREELLRSPVAFKSLLRQGLKMDSFKGRSVVAAMPATDARIMSLTYQVHSGQSDGAAIGKLMQERIGADLSEFVIDYMPVRCEPRDGDRLALVAMSKRSTVVAYLETMRRAGLRVEALEVGPVAIRRLVAEMATAADSTSNVLVINTGKLLSYLTMVSDHRLLFDHEIEFGEQSVLDQIALSLDISPELARGMVLRQGLDPDGVPATAAGIDDTGGFNTLLEIVRPLLQKLVAEIRRAFVFASSESRGPVDNRVFLLGAIARWPGSAQLLSSLAKVKAETIPSPLLPVGGAGRKTKLRAPAPELAVATGLALRGMRTHA